MPIYTYVCTICGAGIERRQSFSEPALTTCENCSGALRRVVHPVGVIFKGSGFYNTDYKNANGRNGSSDKEDGAAKSDEAKPAETTAASTSTGDSAKGSDSSAPSSTAAKSSDSGSGTAPTAPAGKS